MFKEIANFPVIMLIYDLKLYYLVERASSIGGGKGALFFPPSQHIIIHNRALGSKNKDNHHAKDRT